MHGSKGLPEVHQPQPPRLLLPLQMPQQIQPPQAQFLPQVALPQVQVPYAIPLPPERQQGQLPFATLLARGQVQLPYAIPLEPSRNVQLPFATLVAPPQQGQPPLVVPLARARQAEPLLAFPLEPPCPVKPPLAVPPVPLPQQNQQEFPRMMPPRNLVLPPHHQQRLMMFWQDQLRQIQETGYIKNNQLPVARIKKIIKKDETVNMISSEVPILFSKACESFICDLTLRAWLHTEDDNRRTLQRNDISSAITRTDIFDFLIDIVPRNREIETNDYRSLRNNNIYGDGDGGDTNIERGQDEMLESDDSSDNGVTIAYNANIGITDVNDGDTIAYPGIDREDVDDGVTIARSGIDSADVNDGITIAYNPGIGRTDVNDGVTIAHPGNGITNVNAGAGSSAVLAEMMYMHWYQLSVMHYGYMNMIGRYMSEYQQYSRAVLEMSSEEDDNSDG